MSLRKPRALGRTLSFVAAAVSVAGTAITIYSLGPSVTVGGEETLRAADPLVVPFVARNEGFFSASSVQFLCRIVKARLSGAEIGNVAFRQPSLDVPILARGKPVHVPCLMTSVVGGGSMYSAEVEIRVRYRGFLGLWAEDRLFRFEALTEDNGRFKFSPKANQDSTRP
jgi:hypothetical protein